MKVRGRAWVFGSNLDVDLHICPLEAMEAYKDPGAEFTAQELAQFCMVGVDPEFPLKVQTSDILVAGQNFGCYAMCLDGRKDELLVDPHLQGYAALALKGAGVGAVVCDSVNATFLRNCLHYGVPVVDQPGLWARVNQGDELELDLAVGVLRNLTTGGEASFPPLPLFVLELLAVGESAPKLG